ncbi:hypothetical protein GMOD_00009122 [Pyrenophora seminiperda CCB06]|uniref:Uncharacterized protein n=1 Tax=Pyrenophora seminiperda CCB06 TaxID=1302712 RepID=A0A3M7MFN9_9PLEO|nr:hypothetical protein GMOD_00009122 [Pyrenophora seminiperda CCB06]
MATLNKKQHKQAKPKILLLKKYEGGRLELYVFLINVNLYYTFNDVLND